jgi:lipopolysaccharide transport protein LptA
MSFRIPSLGFLAFLCISSMARADFSDTIPSSFGEATYRPRANPTPVPPTVPNVTGSTPPAVAPEKAPVNAPNATTSSPSPTSPAPIATGGNMKSEKVFGDVKHDTRAPVAVLNSKEFVGARNKGLYILNGDVAIAQETLTLKASKMSMFAEQGVSKPYRILAEKDCYLEKIVKPDGSDKIQAWAQDMEYNLKEGKVRFIKDARVVRGQDCNLQGDILEYDMTDGTISGRGVRGKCTPMGTSMSTTK